MAPAQPAAAGTTTGCTGRCARSAGRSAQMRGAPIAPSASSVRRSARRGLLQLVKRPVEGVAWRHDRASMWSSGGRPSDQPSREFPWPRQSNYALALAAVLSVNGQSLKAGTGLAVFAAKILAMGGAGAAGSFQAIPRPPACSRRNTWTTAPCPMEATHAPGTNG